MAGTISSALVNFGPEGSRSECNADNVICDRVLLASGHQEIFFWGSLYHHGSTGYNQSQAFVENTAGQKMEAFVEDVGFTTCCEIPPGTGSSVVVLVTGSGNFDSVVCICTF